MRPFFRENPPKLVLLAVALTLTVSGCAATPEPAPPTAATTPTAAAAPVFASNEEALAAATEAYAAYEEMATLVFAEGGAEPERIQSVTAGKYEDFLLQDLKETRSSGLRTVGKTKFDGLRLQRLDEMAAGGVNVVVVYLCSDVSEIDVLDINNVSQVDANRVPRTALEVGFDWEPGLDGVLTVGSRVAWKGGGVC